MSDLTHQLQICAAVPFADYPAVDGPWDGNKAVQRLRKWASKDGSGKLDKIDWAKYRKGFAAYDEAKPNEFGSYHLPHHDVVDGKLVTSKRGVGAALQVIAGARGGYKGPSGPGAKTHLTKHKSSWSKGDEGELEYRTFGITYKAESINEVERSVRVVASTAAIDSYDEVVEQDWNLTRYNRNPTVLYNHNRPASLFSSMTQEDTLPIGFSTDVGVINGQLEATLHFVDEAASKMAERVWQGVLQKSLRTVSVGFRPGEYADEDRNGQTIRVLKKNELFEISVTPIPANPDAVAKAHELELAERAEEERNMDLQARIDELEAELTQARGEAETHRSVLTAKDTELTELRAQLAERDASLATANAALETANTELAIVAEARKVAEREAATLKIKALVGVKIGSAEVDDYVDDYVADPVKTQKRLDNRPDLHLTEQVIKQAPVTPTPAATGANGLAAAVSKKAQAQKAAE